MDIIKFTSHWNARGKGQPDKLDLKSFTTIRLRNDKKYIAGQLYKIEFESGNTKIEKGEARLEKAYHFLIENLTEYIARIDTGYNKEECTKMIQTIYKNCSPPINWQVQQISLILLVYTDEKKANS